ncbi:MAG: HAMP domain-containing protein [Deltaproteobacteria bacterium]|nr:HAMP domain-containing protein [Deltaproteobacteria bacterium]
MNRRSPSSAAFAAIRRRVLAVPILFKVLGIGALIALMFGVAAVVVVRTHLRSTLEAGIEAQSGMLAGWLASRVEHNLVTGDLLGIHDILAGTWGRLPNIAYLVVEDRAGRAIGRKNAAVDPPAGQPADPSRASDQVTRRTLSLGGLRVYEATFPVLDGAAGRVRVGLDTTSVPATVGAIERRLLLALLVCVLFGQGLALVLSYIITRPIHALVRATGAVEKGELDFKASEFPADEVGALAGAFDRMVASLRRQRSLIRQRDEERVHLLERLMISQEEERRRVALALHDELGQAMTALLLRVRAGGAGRPECLGHKGVMEEQIAGMIEQVRTMARSLRPAVLDDYGLRSALERQIKDLSAGAGCEFDYEFVADDGLDDRFDAAVETVLYRVAQEAITNVIKHAKARRASVVLYRRRGSATLLVEDDGCGFVPAGPAEPSARGGMGVVGMRERVLVMGGEFVIESAPEHGTMIRATLPTGG